MRLLACLIVAPQRGYDEPATLSYAISSFCPTSADGLHGNLRRQRNCKAALGSTSSMQYDACPCPPKEITQGPKQARPTRSRRYASPGDSAKVCPDFALILLRARLPFGRTAMGNNCTPKLAKLIWNVPSQRVGALTRSASCLIYASG